MSRSSPGLDVNNDEPDMEGANDTPHQPMTLDHDAENTADAAQTNNASDAMSVTRYSSAEVNAIESAPIRSRFTKIWLEQLYLMISWMLVPQTPPTQTIAAAPVGLSPVFPTFSAVHITPGLASMTQMSPGTPIWIPGSPESPDGMYGQTISQHANIRFVGTPQAGSSMVVPFSSTPNVDASPHRPAINICI